MSIAPGLAERLLYAPPYAYRRRPTREVMVGDVGVGGDYPIRVQSMTTTRTQDVEATVAQARRLVEVGCEIVRITAPTVADAKALGEILRSAQDDNRATHRARRVRPAPEPLTAESARL